MPAPQPDCWASTGAVPAAVNAAKASAIGRYLLTAKSFFMLRLLLTMIAPYLGPKRTAASCDTAHQHFERECGLLRLRGHDCASSSLRLWVTTARVACCSSTAEISPNRSRSRDIPTVVLDESIGYAFLALSKLGFSSRPNLE